MAVRSRPPVIVGLQTLRLAGSVVGEIEHEPAAPFTLTLTPHPAGKWYGLFAEVSLGEGDSFLAIHTVATLDLGTGSWKRMELGDLATYLASAHRHTLWDNAAATLRQLAALCDASVEIPLQTPEPVVQVADPVVRD